MCIQAQSAVNYRMLPAIEKDQGKQQRSDQVSSFNLGLKKKKNKQNSDESEKVGKRVYSKQGNNISKGTGTENFTHEVFTEVQTYSPSTECEEGGGEMKLKRRCGDQVLGAF